MRDQTLDSRGGLQISKGYNVAPCDFCYWDAGLNFFKKSFFGQDVTLVFLASLARRLAPLPSHVIISLSTTAFPHLRRFCASRLQPSGKEYVLSKHLLSH